MGLGGGMRSGLGGSRRFGIREVETVDSGGEAGKDISSGCG